VKFKCPSCSMTLQAEADMAGKTVRCPGCDAKLQIPAVPMPTAGDTADHAGEHGPWDGDHAESHTHTDTAPSSSRPPVRTGWEETDPANANIWVSLAIGAVATAVWYGMLLPLGQGDYGTPPVNALDYMHDLFYERTWVNFMETFFFFWAIGIIWLKWTKLRQQRNAMYIDVLPRDISDEINGENVGIFIDRFYEFPHRLRDSMMVNRLRKALELFEVRKNNGEVASMMAAQSNIDGSRIGNSYTLIKVFLWAIPILGFIGTVIGLSQAIGSMDLASGTDALMSSIGKVTGGLGTAFDTTLLGLVLAMILNFPMNALLKSEDDNLNAIDAYCNEVLLPRLNDGAADDVTKMMGDGSSGDFLKALTRALTAAQTDLIEDLKKVTAKISEQATNLDKRADSHAAQVAAEFSRTMIKLREEVTTAVAESSSKTTDYVGSLASGLQGLNNVLRELGEKQVVIQQVKKKGWFGR
jgi:hypothetical protein